MGFRGTTADPWKDQRKRRSCRQSPKRSGDAGRDLVEGIQRSLSVLPMLEGHIPRFRQRCSKCCFWKLPKWLRRHRHVLATAWLGQRQRWVPGPDRGSSHLIYQQQYCVGSRRPLLSIQLGTCKSRRLLSGSSSRPAPRKSFAPAAEDLAG